MSHFASRLGLDQQSVRGIPEKKQASIPTMTAKPKDDALTALAARVAALEASLSEANETICVLIEEVEALQARDNVTRDSVTSVTPAVTSSVTRRRGARTLSGSVGGVSG
jgi:Tfp pilus assembly protein FimV